MGKYLYDDYIIRLSEKFTRRLEDIESDFNFELGDEFEYAVCDILQNLLPDKYGVTRGFVVNRNGEKRGDDIIIYDRHRFPTLRSHGKNQFHRLENIPIEAVYAYIEAKHTIEYEFGNSKCTFFKAFKQATEVKELMSQRQKASLFMYNPYIVGEPLFKNNLEYGNLPKFNNPAFSCVISRNFLFKKKADEEVDLNSLDFLNKNLLIPKQNTIPDLVVLNKDIVLSPRSFQNGEFGKGGLFSHDANTLAYSTTICPNIGYGVFLTHLLFAIDWIRLDKMPWQDIHSDAIKNSPK